MMDPSPDLPPSFQTARFVLQPEASIDARELVEHLLLDDALAASMPWMAGKTPEDVGSSGRELAAAVELGMCKMWTILTRTDSTAVGIMIVRNDGDGIVVEVMLEPECELDDLVDELVEPVLGWVGTSAELMRDPLLLH